jgi:death on curing protein
MTIKVIGYIYLDEDDVVDIHNDQLAQFGGASGIRNRDALLSAVGQPQATFGTEDLYPDVYIKAAVLAYCIAESQIFVDGNKRTALVAALTFLKVNGQQVPDEEDRLYDAMIAIANKTMSKEDLADLLRDLVCEFNSKSED